MKPHRKLQEIMQQHQQQAKTLSPVHKAIGASMFAIEEIVSKQIEDLYGGGNLKAGDMYPNEIACILSTAPIAALMRVFLNADLRPTPTPVQKRRALLDLLNKTMQLIPQYMADVERSLSEQIQLDYEIALSGEPFDPDKTYPSEVN